MKRKVFLGIISFLVMAFFIVWIVFHNFVYLVAAVIKENREQVVYLIDKKEVSPNSWGMNLINLYLSQKGKEADLSFIVFLLDKGVNPDYGRGVPLFHKALSLERNDIVQLLIDKGADVNVLMKNGEIRPLTAALILKNCDAAMMLDKSGAHMEGYNMELFLTLRLKRCYLKHLFYYDELWKDIIKSRVPWNYSWSII